MVLFETVNKLVRQPNYFPRSFWILEKCGEWAKMLTQLHGRIQQDANKRSATFRYYGAEQIKARFEE